MSDEIALKNKFSNWVMKIQFEMLESNLFQAIGLELSSTNINLETTEDYTFNGIEKSEIDNKNYPLAYYNPLNNSIHVYIEHYSFEIRNSDDEKYAFLFFILCHEAQHKLFMHSIRGKEKDHELYNIAADMEIHNMMYIYDIIMLSKNNYSSPHIFQMFKKYIEDFLFKKSNSKKSEGLFEKNFLQLTAEEIYTVLEKSKKESIKTYSCIDNNSTDDKQNTPITVKQVTYKLPSGKEITSTIVSIPESQKSNENTEKNGLLTRRALMENTMKKYIKEINEENCKGDIGADCKTFLTKLFHIKIDWKKILRNSLLTALEKSEYFSWAQPRTSLFGLSNTIYLPGQIEDETSYGTVIIARDESGSMSDTECEKAAGIIADAKEYYKKIVLIKHDVNITSITEMYDLDENAKKILLTRESRGGTSHKKVFEFIKNYSINNEENERISCCIFITDMISDIEEYQNIIPNSIPRIWIAPQKSASLYKNKVKGKIISV